MNTFIALPCYSTGHRDNAMALLEVTGIGNTFLYECASSLLCHGFNGAWAAALNMTPRPDRFMMLHSDIVPESGWMQALEGERARVGAHVLSVVVPIKTPEGLTSTALETSDPWRPRRLTMTELFKQYPETWTDPKLLVNTGLWVADFTMAWVEQVCFTMAHKVERNPKGAFEAFVQPEDWHFSRQLRALGVDPWVTRKVKVEHVGVGRYSNAKVWGTHIKDPQRVSD